MRYRKRPQTAAGKVGRIPGTAGRQGRDTGDTGSQVSERITCKAFEDPRATGDDQRQQGDAMVTYGAGTAKLRGRKYPHIRWIRRGGGGGSGGGICHVAFQSGCGARDQRLFGMQTPWDHMVIPIPHTALVRDGAGGGRQTGPHLSPCVRDGVQRDQTAGSGTERRGGNIMMRPESSTAKADQFESVDSGSPTKPGAPSQTRLRL